MGAQAAMPASKAIAVTADATRRGELDERLSDERMEFSFDKLIKTVSEQVSRLLVAEPA
jgi:hypothetical protein